MFGLSYLAEEPGVLTVQQSEPEEHGVDHQTEPRVASHEQSVHHQNRKHKDLVVQNCFFKQAVSLEDRFDVEVAGQLQRRDQDVGSQLEERRPAKEPRNRKHQVLEVFCRHESEVRRKRLSVELRRNGNAVADPDPGER
ncbi:hypothetical protein OGAPHI_005363 [Ogataea philodendri]|uniref:Uncharacterized protein n=1 Tax=Ogataea philodendri TaxID=1378263 RepID=A0A9P8P0M2_9ASCO|nr:uncharacterized protein OGAPHI_005363 [Ogataea philodendri]KAH3663373.1 hypothetical protein OGAPHI_005363 [Ogataea philodendri]